MRGAVCGLMGQAATWWAPCRGVGPAPPPHGCPVLIAALLPLRQQVLTAFTDEFLAAPFTDQLFHFVIPALADAQTNFPYEAFLSALLFAESRAPKRSVAVPWLFYFVLTVGENHLGMTRWKMCPEPHGGPRVGSTCPCLGGPYTSAGQAVQWEEHPLMSLSPVHLPLSHSEPAGRQTRPPEPGRWVSLGEMPRVVVLRREPL